MCCLSFCFSEKISYAQFCEICKKEPITTEDELMKAFKKIDINGDGFISHSELKKVMTTVRCIDELLTFEFIIKPHLYSIKLE